MSDRAQDQAVTRAYLERVSPRAPQLLEQLLREPGMGARVVPGDADAPDVLLDSARALLMALFVAQLAEAKVGADAELSFAALCAALERGPDGDGDGDGSGNGDGDGDRSWARVQALLAPHLALVHCVDAGALWAALDQAPPSAAWQLACLRTLAPSAGLPAECIGELYETTLDYRLERGEAGLALCAWTATRKGAGSFYTPAGLSEPTVRRVLEPLIHDESGRVRAPQELLALRICDPAMGGGSFLLASLRALGDALQASLRIHSTPAPSPASTQAAARRESTLAQVAQTCLFGVDRDPLAVELGRAALWIEAGAPAPGPAHSCPGLRCGDALLGAWADRVSSYPLAAFERRAQDASARAALRAKRRELSAPASPEERARGPSPRPLADAVAPRAQYDLWSALWFWPLDALDAVPLPAELAQPSARAATIVEGLARELRLFHWELAFPEVFARPNPGFDAVVTNPPWDIHKPSSKEFFSRYVPGYRGLAKQAALEVQRELFEASPASKASWHAQLDGFRARSHFLRHLAQPRADRAPQSPFAHQGPADLNAYKLFVELAYVLARHGGQLGLLVPSGLYTDKGTQALRALLLQACEWRWLYGFENRQKLFDIDARFKFCALVAGKGGRSVCVRAAFMRRELDDWGAGVAAIDYPTAWMAELSPASSSVVEICSRRDLEVLRKIHAGSVTLGTEAAHGWGIRYAREFDMTNDSAHFITRDAAEGAGMHGDVYGRWRAPSGELYLPLYEGRMIDAFDFSAKGWVSGRGRSAKWRDIGWDAKQVEAQYLVRDDVYRARVRARERGQGQGQGSRSAAHDFKLCFMAVGSATNRRSMIAALVRGVPCGNAVPVLRARGGLVDCLGLAAVLNSFVYDFALRARLGGLNLNYFVISETALPAPESLPPALILASARLCMAHSWYAPGWIELLRMYPQLEAQPLRWALTWHERLRLRCMIDAAVATIYGLSRDDLGWILADCDHGEDSLVDRSFCRRLAPKGFWRVARERAPQLRHSVLTMVAHDALSSMLAQHGGPRSAIQRFFDEDGGWRLPERLDLATLELERRVVTTRERVMRGSVSVCAAAGPRWLHAQRAQTAREAWEQCRRVAQALGSSPCGARPGA